VSKSEKNNPFENDKKQFTHREIAAMLGEILWSHRVRRLKPLYHVDLMKIFGANTPATVQQWDEINPKITQQQLSILREELATAREHQRCQTLPEWYPEKSTTFQYAVDASMEDDRDVEGLSDSQIAICERLGERKWRWKNKTQRFSYIGESELEAIVWSVRDAVVRSNKEVTCVAVATDSLCAKGWVERMYSERPAAQILLRELDDYLSGKITGRAIRISCIYVRTDDNIADVPSRVEEVGFEGDQDTWLSKIDDNEEIHHRMKKSSSLLVDLKNLVASEGRLQGRQAIRTERTICDEM